MDRHALRVPWCWRMRGFADDPGHGGGPPQVQVTDAARTA